MLAEFVGRGKQGTPVRPSGQRVGQGVDALLEPLALLDHCEDHESQGDTAKRGNEDNRGEPIAGEYQGSLADQHAHRQWQPGEVADAGGDEEHDGGPAR